MVKRRHIVTALLAFACAGIVGAFSYIARGYYYSELAQSGVRTEAIVKQIGGGLILYEFPFGDGRAGRWGVPYRTPISEIKVGDKILITYSSRHPWMSVPGDAPAVYRSWLRFTFLLVACIFFTPIAIVIAVDLYRSHLTPRFS
jgi:hypothetical protein